MDTDLPEIDLEVDESPGVFLDATSAWLARRMLAKAAREQPRCWGISSDAMVLTALGEGRPELSDYPRDVGDLNACERTFAMAPDMMKWRMKPVLDDYREHVAEMVGAAAMRRWVPGDQVTAETVAL